MAEGTLYVVATPIGNLGDITFRAVETLRDVDVIVAEDTRHTRKLLVQYGVTTPLKSWHAHSSDAKTAAVVEELSRHNVAVVTDAGTPGIADPGGKLVEAARQAGYEVVPTPGASAGITALSASGLNTDQFTFIGFLPHKKGRQTLVRSLSSLVQPVVLYESPHRLSKLLGEVASHYPEASVIVARELTKLHEEFRTGSPTELVEHYTSHPPKGEVTVVVRL